MALNSTNSDSLIIPQISKMLIEPLSQASTVLSANVTTFASSEPIRVPTLTGETNPAWVGENELIPESDDLEFGEIELMPTNRKSIKTLTRVSNELVRMAKIGVAGVLQRRLVTDVRDKLDTALLVGDGADNSVLGIVNQPGVTTDVWEAGNPDSILDALALMAGMETQPNMVLMNGEDFFTIRKLKDGDGRYLMQASLSDGATYTIHGIPVRVTNKLPQGTLIMADWSDVAVVRDINPTVKLDSSRYLEYDQTAIRVTSRYDLGILRNESVLVLTETP